MKLKTPPEYVLRGLRMALGVAACLAIGFMGINYQFIGKSSPLWHALWMLDVIDVHTGLQACFTWYMCCRACHHAIEVIQRTKRGIDAFHGRNADQGEWGEHMCDLVGNAARSGAITCVVSRRRPSSSAMSTLQRTSWPKSAPHRASCTHVHLDWLDLADTGTPCAALLL